MEQWRNIIGYEDSYEVSSHGSVRTKEGKTTVRSDGVERTWKQRVLKQKTDKNGYKRVSLWLNGKEKTRLVHRLVAEAFIENQSNLPLINHKDTNPSNNEYTNLEWCDHIHNLEHAYDNKLNQSCIFTKLIDKETGEEIVFNSMTKASKYIGRNHGWISGSLKRGKHPEDDKYIIELIND